MSTIYDYKLFEAHCEGCGKLIPTTATNKAGHLKKVYCNRVCETKAADKKKFHPVYGQGYFK